MNTLEEWTEYVQHRAALREAVHASAIVGLFWALRLWLERERAWADGRAEENEAWELYLAREGCGCL